MQAWILEKGCDAYHALLQLAQLEALQEEHPEDIGRDVPSLERETPLKLENSLSISPDWQSGQAIPFSDDIPKISFSNSDSHFRHLYSNMGIPVYLTFRHALMLAQFQICKQIRKQNEWNSCDCSGEAGSPLNIV